MRFRHPVNERHHGDGRTFGERAADSVAAAVGSWRFIIIQTVLVAGWVGGNVYFLTRPLDKYPFILLNLLFSLQAAYTGPILQLAGNRQSAKDRDVAEHTFENTQLLQDLLKQNTALTEEIHTAIHKT